MNTFELPSYISLVLQKLNEAGKEAYIVGGAVRDHLLGKQPHDFDVATSALPQKTMEVFAGYNMYTNGIKHGTVGVIVDHQAVEITTFRTDAEYLDNRHPDHVTFVRSLKEDIFRRDFTINAMAYHPDKGIIDYVGGQEDLKHGIVRAIGEPKKRFEEDALRILRALRFSARLNFTIEEKTEAALFSERELLQHIARERMSTEFTMLLKEKAGIAVVKKYAEILKYAADFPFENLSLSDDFFEREDSFAFRFAAVLYDLKAENGKEELKRMKLSKAEITHILYLLEEINTDLSDSLIQAEHLRKHSLEGVMELVEFQKRFGYCEEAEEVLSKLKERWESGIYSLNQLAVSGADLTEIPPAKRAGILENLLNRVILEELPNKRDVLLEEIAKMKNT